MKKLLFLLLISSGLYFFCNAQINPAPGSTKPIPNKTFPKKEYVENVDLLISYNWWRRVNPANTIYFLSLNLVNFQNNDTSFKSYSSKSVMSLIGFDSNTNMTSLSGDSLVHLAPLVTLEKLLVRSDINDAGILHLQSLKNLTHLESAYTHSAGSRNEYRDIRNNSMDVISGLHSLEILRLHSCRNVTDDGLAKLAGLTNLKELDLTQWGITDNGLNSLSKMNKLEELNLTATAITDAGVDILISILPGMPSFKKIILSRSQVSEKYKQLLLERYPGITIL